MDAVEQAMAVQVGDAGPEQRFAGRRHKQHRAVAAVPGDHVGHGPRQQSVTILLGVEQPDTGARQSLGAERQARRIERG